MKKIIIAIVVFGLLVVSGVGTWSFSNSSKNNVFSVVYDRKPSVMEVASQDIHQAFLRQYRLNPDRRFMGAFLYLVQEYNNHALIKTLKLEMQLSETKEDPLILVLKKGIVEVGRVQLPATPTFESLISGLDQWVTLLNQAAPPLKQKGTADPEKLKAVDIEINNVDQREIISGLINLEEMWQDTHDPAILKSTVRAYTLLLLTLIPDKMGESDSLASCALAYLALAKNMETDLPLGQEEALLAMAMGYRMHAKRVLQNTATESDYTGRCMRAYLEDNFQQLNEINKQQGDVLGYYLLARTYRNLGLDKQAISASEQLLRLLPAGFPSLVELIYASQVGYSKVLTFVFPLEILHMMESSLMKKPDLASQTWQERVKAIAGEPGGGISLSEFEDMLRQWKPLSGRVRKGFLINTDCVKNVFRVLYSNALYLRFHLLFQEWAVQEQTSGFVDNLLEKDAEHPLIMSMLAKVSVDLGQQEKAQKIVEKLLLANDCPAAIAIDAYNTLGDSSMQIEQLSNLASHLDSRPGYAVNLAWCLQENYYYDQALDLYRHALAINPYLYGIYINLTTITGSDKPILDALDAMGDNYAVLARAGNYFANKATPDSLKQALDCYEKAISLLPDNYNLYIQKAVILRKLGRYQEALDTMQPWVGKYKDLTDVFIRSNMAKTYLAMEEAKGALSILGDATDSYQAGAMMLVSEIYIAEGDLHKAQDIIERAVKRYPSTDWLLSEAAAFYWQKKEPEKAARLIAQGAKRLPEFSTWFFDDFLKIFATESQENILEAVRLLRDAGIGNWQIRSLKARFAWHKRYDVALKIDDLVKDNQAMTRLENLLTSYNIVRQWKGAEEAKKWLLERVPDKMKEMASMVIINRGEFDLVDDFVFPEKSAPKYREFLWLTRLIGWLGMDKQPAASVKLFEEHYRKQSQDYYFSIGQYLLGMKEESVLLGMLKNIKQRCEFAYYIGLKHRLEGDFRGAAEWYAICLETLQENNGEYHWAGDELFWWAKMGIERRHRLVRDDIALGRQEDQAIVTSQVF